MIAFNGPLRPGDAVIVEWEGKRFEGRIEEIAFRAGNEVGRNIIQSEPIKLTVALIQVART